jgi:hypothetical protein
MSSKRIFGLITALFWLLFAVLVTLDSMYSNGTRVEPPPLALGSGQAASGGHCSGR